MSVSFALAGDIGQAILLGILGVFFLRGMFLLVRYRQEAFDMPDPGMSDYEIIVYYASAMDALRGTSTRWSAYFLFRAIPTAIAFFAVGGIGNRMDIPPSYLWISYLVLNAIFIAPIIKELRPRNSFYSVILVHVATLMVVIGAGAIVTIVSIRIDTSFLIPSAASIRDSAWAALIVAIIVAAYFSYGSVEKRRVGDDEIARERCVDLIQKRALVVSEKYRGEVLRASRTSCVDPDLILAILVYESLNRPKLLRLFELVCVKLFHLPLTVGIAQVRSNRAISDSESIQEMAIILKRDWEDIVASGRIGEVAQNELLARYNGGSRYADNVLAVFDLVRGVHFARFSL